MSWSNGGWLGGSGNAGGGGGAGDEDILFLQEQINSLTGKINDNTVKIGTVNESVKATDVKINTVESKLPKIATNNDIGLVKGSDTVNIDTDGSLQAIGGGSNADPTIVVSPPVVTVESKVGINFPFDIKVDAGLVLLPGAYINKFEFIINDTPSILVNAVNNSATYTHTHSALGELNISVIAIDNLGNRSEITKKSIECIPAFIQAPTILAPEEDATFVIIKLMVVTDAFVSVAVSDTHVASQYQIQDSNNGDIIYTSEEITGNSLSYTITDAPLSPGTRYRILARHKGEVLGWSEWASGITAVARSIDIIAFTYSGYCNVSSDEGVTWAKSFKSGIPTGQYPIITWGNGTFVLASNDSNGKYGVSKNGTTWSEPMIFPAISYIYKLTFINNKFFVLGQKYILISDDGITWYKTNAPALNWVTITYGNDKFIAAGNIGAGLIQTSTSVDGVTWTESKIVNTFNYVADSIYKNGICILMGERSEIVTSIDGITWTTPHKVSSIFDRFTAFISWDKDIVIHDFYNMAKSTDGITWNITKINGGPIGVTTARGKAYFNSWNRIYRSTDLINWPQISEIPPLPDGGTNWYGLYAI